MRCYFVMMMLDVVDLSELILICDELHNIFAMGKLGFDIRYVMNFILFGKIELVLMLGFVS